MNYEQVIKDFNSGELDRSKVQLTMDNDGGYWLYIDETKSEDECDEIAQKLDDKYGSPDGYQDVVNILIAAGVNADWC